MDAGTTSWRPANDDNPLRRRRPRDVRRQPRLWRRRCADRPERKIYRLASGGLLGCRLPTSVCRQELARWIDAGGDTANPPRIIGELKMDAIPALPDGGVFRYGGGSFMSTGPIKARWHAVGTGGEYVLGAVYAGVAPMKAMRIAIELDVWSGLPMVTVPLQPDRKG